MKLYNFITNEKGISLPSSDSFPHNNDLIIILKDLTHFDEQAYHNPHQLLHIVKDFPENERITEAKKIILNNEQNIKDDIHIIYENELRLRKSEKQSLLSLRIAILAFVISFIQLIIDSNDIYWGKDYKYETTSLKIDSIKVKQNDLIIQLLVEQNSNLKNKQNIKLDTIISSVKK